MANILGLKGYSTPTINALIAAYGNGFVNVDTGLGYGIPLSSTNNVEFEVFLQSLFFQNYVDTPLTFNGTSWSRRHVSKVPLSRYIKLGSDNRLYLGYIKIGSTEYPSRVWYSNLPSNDTIQWGYETGSTLKTYAGSQTVYCATAGFKTYGLKRGDPIFILDGSDIGQYFIQEVSNDQFLILTQPLTTTATGVSFWAGGNFIDVDRDDGDFVTWIEENNSQRLFFKRDSLHRYNGTSRVKVRDAVGTTSGRSVQNLHEYTIYFHGSDEQVTGFYAFNGSQSSKISSPIEPYIQGINSSNYTSIVAWREAELYRAYVGDITNQDAGISIEKAVFTFDYTSSTWSIDPIEDLITASTQYRTLGVKKTYLGTSDDEVLLTPFGNSYNDSPVPWRVRMKTVYPSGVGVSNTFTRIEVYSEKANAVRVQYKLHLKGDETEENFNNLGQITGEKTTLFVPDQNNQAAGIQLQFTGIDTTEPTALIKKVIIYYRGDKVTLYG